MTLSSHRVKAKGWYLDHGEYLYEYSSLKESIWVSSSSSELQNSVSEVSANFPFCCQRFSILSASKMNGWWAECELHWNHKQNAYSSIHCEHCKTQGDLGFFFSLLL